MSLFHRRFLLFVVLPFVAMASAASGCSGNGSSQNRPRPASDGGGGTSGYLPVTDVDGGGGGSSARPDDANGGVDATTSDDAFNAPSDVAVDVVAPPTGDAITSESSSPSGPTDAGAAVNRRYEAESGSLFGQAARIACASCSGSQRVRLPADSAFTLEGIDVGGTATQSLVVHFTNGDSVPRSIYVGLNGAPSQVFPAFFPPTGGWDKVSAISLSLSGFRAGSNNEVTFFIDSEQNAPDVDFVEVGPMPSFTAQAIETDGIEPPAS